MIIYDDHISSSYKRPKDAPRGTQRHPVRDQETPKTSQEAPLGPPERMKRKNSQTAAEWRRYHARSPQHSDVLEAPKKFTKTIVFFC